ncbi:hypothetical protein SDC9_190572 [bioreactor metagenome]|uniref:Lipoprotein n=1 Tax=bioreactor metagenome TaxID=1076179 RepID=A0A645I6D0_9ZZZZ|nr:hypothetical protein [Anaerorhabdus sp.]MEA4873994.1 hypothetical protein [Anaerorhabdus sp.]
MKKIIKLLLASLLLAGCANTSKPEPTPTATPEPTVEATPNVIKGEVTEWYMQVERDGECYWDQNGNFVHNHPLDLDNYIIDLATANNLNDDVAICTSLDMQPEFIEHYKNNNGEHT